MGICEDGTQWDFLTVEGTQAMTVGQETYTYTTIAASLGVTAVTQILDLGTGVAGIPFQYLAWDDYNAVKALNPALPNGTPSLWTLVGDASASVWPKPSAVTALRVLALKQATELVADGDVPFLPLQARRRVLVNGAAAVLLRTEGGFEAQTEAEYLEQQYEQAYKALKDAHTLPGPVRTPTPEPVQLPSGLQGVTGSFLDLAQRACYAAGLRPWMNYDMQRAREAVNQAYLRVAGSGDQWDWLEKEGTLTATVNQADYAYTAIATALSTTAGVNEVLSVVNDTTGSTPLVPMPWVELERRVESTGYSGNASGEPIFFTILGDGAGDRKLRFFPKPDQAYSLRILARLKATRLSADTDLTLLPADFAYAVLVPMAAALLLKTPGSPSTWSERIALADRLEQDGKAGFAAMREAHAAARAPLAMAIGASYPLSEPTFSSGSWGDW